MLVQQCVLEPWAKQAPFLMPVYVKLHWDVCSGSCGILGKEHKAVLKLSSGLVMEQLGLFGL